MSASGYINEMVKKGIISGYSNGTFQPTKILNRGEMAILLSRAFNFGSGNAAQYLMEKGIAQGFSDGTFGEKANIIRADFSVFVARSLNEAFRVKTGEVAFSKTMYVNAGSDTLNMRKAPSTTATIISKLKSGTAVSVAKTENGWAYIRVNNVIGYVSASYLSVTKPATPVVSSNLSVVIDPGHGGQDPGATGVSGQGVEKALALATAIELADLLEKRGRVRVALTREDDRYLSLEQRAAIARRACVHDQRHHRPRRTRTSFPSAARCLRPVHEALFRQTFHAGYGAHAHGHSVSR
jgi:N-acetylmuramoyl-L-alanine amidase